MRFVLENRNLMVAIVTHGLFRRLQARRSQPLVDMCSSFRLSRLAQFRFAVGTRWKHLGFVAQASHLADKAVFERLSLFEAATLEHGAAPFLP